MKLSSNCVRVRRIHITDAKGGRSLPGHTAWLAKLPCPIPRIEGALMRDEVLKQALAGVMTG